jgi:hypothetical protein
LGSQSRYASSEVSALEKKTFTAESLFKGNEGKTFRRSLEKRICPSKKVLKPQMLKNSP